MLLDALGDGLEAHGLRDEGEAADHVPAFFFGHDGGEENDGDVVQERVGADLLGDIAAVDFRHHHIEEDDVRRKIARGEPGLGAVVFLLHDEAPGLFERELEEVGEARFVIDYKDALFCFVWHGCGGVGY